MVRGHWKIYSTWNNRFVTTNIYSCPYSKIIWIWCNVYRLSSCKSHFSNTNILLAYKINARQTCCDAVLQIYIVSPTNTENLWGVLIILFGIVHDMKQNHNQPWVHMNHVLLRPQRSNFPISPTRGNFMSNSWKWKHLWHYPLH